MSMKISPTGGRDPCWDPNKTEGSSDVNNHYQCVRISGFAFHVNHFHLLTLAFSDFQEKSLLLRGAPGIVHRGRNGIVWAGVWVEKHQGCKAVLQGVHVERNRWRITGKQH